MWRIRLPYFILKSVYQVTFYFTKIFRNPYIHSVKGNLLLHKYNETETLVSTEGETKTYRTLNEFEI